MDTNRFDALVRSLTARGSRRRALSLALGGTLAALLGQETTQADGSGAFLRDRHENRNRRRTCPRPCGPCQRCSTHGRCLAKRNNSPCRGGTCHRGRCVATPPTPPARLTFATFMGGGASVTFVDGPGTPPQSTGSAQFTVPPPPFSDAAFAHLRSEDFLGVEIDDLTTLTYAMFVDPANSICPAFDVPYVVLYVTTTVGSEDIIVSKPQGAPFACGTWTLRDALADLWWSPTLAGGSFAPLASPRPLGAFAAAFTGLAIRNDATPDVECPTALGGFRIATGNWGAVNQQDTYVANVSVVSVGVSGTTRSATF